MSIGGPSSIGFVLLALRPNIDDIRNGGKGSSTLSFLVDQSRKSLFETLNSTSNGLPRSSISVVLTSETSPRKPPVMASTGPSAFQLLLGVRRNKMRMYISESPRKIM